MGVVAERAGLDYKPSGITEPERHFFPRVLVFIFGALPTVIKALALQRDRISYWLLLGFFIPFLILEFIERLAKPPTLARLANATRIPVQKKLGVTISRQMATLFALTFHNDLYLEIVNLALIKSIFKANPFKSNRFITRFSTLIAIIVPLSLEIYELALKDKRSQLAILSLSIDYLILFNTAFKEIIHM